MCHLVIQECTPGRQGPNKGAGCKHPWHRYPPNVWSFPPTHLLFFTRFADSSECGGAVRAERVEAGVHIDRLRVQRRRGQLHRRRQGRLLPHTVTVSFARSLFPQPTSQPSHCHLSSCSFPALVLGSGLARAYAFSRPGSYVAVGAAAVAAESVCVVEARRRVCCAHVRLGPDSPTLVRTQRLPVPQGLCRPVDKSDACL